MLCKLVGPALAIGGCLLIAFATVMMAQQAVSQVSQILLSLRRFQAPGYATFSRILGELTGWGAVGMAGFVCIITGILMHISLNRCRCAPSTPATDQQSA